MSRHKEPIELNRYPMGILSQSEELELKTAEGLRGKAERICRLGRSGMAGESVRLVRDYDLDTGISGELARHMCV